MIDFLLFALSVIGMTHIIVDGSIFQGVRDVLKKWLPTKLYRLFECYQCTGTWAGFFLGYFLLHYTDLFAIFACGCAGSFLATWAATDLNYLEARIIVSIEEDV